MSSLNEEAEGDMFSSSSDESWNKVEVDVDDDDCAVDEPLPEGAPPPAAMDSNDAETIPVPVRPDALEFPDRVTATSENDESESSDTVLPTKTTELPVSVGRGAGVVLPSIDDSMEQTTTMSAADAPDDDDDDDVDDAAEPAPVMSPAEIGRANSIRSPPDHSIASPTTTKPTTSQLAFPHMNLVLPSLHGISLENRAAAAAAAAADSTGHAALLIGEHNHAFGLSQSGGLDMASPTMTTPTPTATANFAHVIRERTRQRRLKDDAAVASLRVQVTRLEAALAAACKRRVESMRTLQTHATTAVSNLETRLSEQVTTDVNRVNERLNGLEQRMAALEARWNDDVCGVQEDLSHTSQQLHSQWQTLQHAVAQERLQASTRHERMMQQIQTVSLSYDEQWRHERQDRMASVLSLQDTMNSVHSERELNVATMEGQLQEELRALQAAVALEQHERRAHDDDIVQSLNRYTRYIQESLAATTGVTGPTTTSSFFGGNGGGGGGSTGSTSGGGQYDTLTLR